MDQTRFSVDSNGSIGCTFLEWSIHYLTGEQSYYSWYKNKPIELSYNPVSDVNAHKHFKNHPAGAEETKRFIEETKDQSSNRLLSCYSTDLVAHEINDSLGISDDNFNSKLSLIQDFINEDRQKRIDYLHNNKFKLIHLYVDQYIYSFMPSRSLDQHKTPEDIAKRLVDIYFNESKKKYSQFDLWDFRELLALTFSSKLQEFKRNKELVDYKNSLKLSRPHKFIIAEDLWVNGEELMADVLNFLNLNIDYKRLEQWSPIYKQWQNIQLKRMSFIYNINHIVDSIVNNYECDLSRYNLTIIHEAIIQSKLLKDHNLTIKNYQLEKFPDNTQDIHKLLEENFHAIL